MSYVRCRTTVTPVLYRQASEPHRWQFELGGDGLGAAGVLLGLGKSALKRSGGGGSRGVRMARMIACITRTVVLYLYVGQCPGVR
jgi:hypothetical protein